jgi:phosphate-selective porin
MENTSDKTITRVWYKRTGVLYHKIYKKNVEHSLTLIDFYCGKRKCKYVEAVFYFTDGSYETYTFGDFLDHIVPDTAIEELYNTMCKNY